MQCEFQNIFVHSTTFDCIIQRNCIVCLYKIFSKINLKGFKNCTIPPNRRPEQCFHFESSQLPDTTPWLGLYCLQSSTVLTVGDGDFSFSLALARSCGKVRLVATSHESRQTICSVYPNSDQILEELSAWTGVKVMHGVDATDLGKHQDIKSEFDVIVWNFPCVSMKPGKDGQVSEIDTNKDMLRSFFRNAIKYLKLGGRREIHITHKTIEPFSWWNIATLAEEVGLVHIGSFCFDRCLYPGYINRKVLDKKSFPSSDAQTFIFRAPIQLNGKAGTSTLVDHPHLLHMGSDEIWGRLMSHIQEHYSDGQLESNSPKQHGSPTVAIPPKKGHVTEPRSYETSEKKRLRQSDVQPAVKKQKKREKMTELKYCSEHRPVKKKQMRS